MSTLMDYSRFNYVAQPEDKIPVDLLVPRIGPYDMWATHWGYAPIAPMQVAQQSSTRTTPIDGAEQRSDARQVGARAGHEAVAPLLDVGRVRLRSGRRDRSGRRHRPRERDRARIQESQTQHAVDRVRDGEADRGLRRDGGALRPTDRTVPHGAGTCRESRRRNELAGEVRRSAGHRGSRRFQRSGKSRR